MGSIHYGNVGWFESMNVSRGQHRVAPKAKTFEDLIVSMQVSGWQDGPEHAPVLGPLSLVSEAVIKTEVERRAAEIELAHRLVVATPGDAAASAKLSVLREAYCLPDGTPRKIEHWGVTGHCRALGAIEAAIRRKTGTTPKDVGDDIPSGFNWMIPVDIKSFSTLADALFAQVLENEKKDLGFSRPSAVDRLYGARALYRQGVSQTRLRDAYKASEGQRLWAILRLDGRFPRLKVFERLTIPAAKLKEMGIDRPKLDLTPMQPQDLLTLRRQAFPDELDGLNRSRRQEGQPDLPLLSEDECEARLLVLSVKGNAGGKGGMSKAEFGDWTSQVSGNPIAWAALTAVKSKDTGSSVMIQDTAEAMSGVVGLYKNLTAEQWAYMSVKLGKLALITATEFEDLCKSLDSVIGPLAVSVKPETADTTEVEVEDPEDGNESMLSDDGEVPAEPGPEPVKIKTKPKK